MVAHNKPKFRLGKIVITQGALGALSKSEQLPDLFLKRHIAGEWGDICGEDADLNNEAIANEGDIVLVQREQDKSTFLFLDFSCLWRIMKPPLAGLFLLGFFRHVKTLN